MKFTILIHVQIHTSVRVDVKHQRGNREAESKSPEITKIVWSWMRERKSILSSNNTQHTVYVLYQCIDRRTVCDNNTILTDAVIKEGAVVVKLAHTLIADRAVLWANRLTNLCSIVGIVWYGIANDKPNKTSRNRLNQAFPTAMGKLYVMH